MKPALEDFPLEEVLSALREAGIIASESDSGDADTD
jgi:hypothetical protein